MSENESKDVETISHASPDAPPGSEQEQVHAQTTQDLDELSERVKALGNILAADKTSEIDEPDEASDEDSNEGDEAEEGEEAEDEGEGALDGALGTRKSKKKKGKQARKLYKSIRERLNLSDGSTEDGQASSSKSESNDSNILTPGMYEQILSQVRRDHGEKAAKDLEGKRELVGEALKGVGIKDLVEGKKGLGRGNRKDLADHKFWSTQPVPKGYDPESRAPADGPIEPNKQPQQIKNEGIPLPTGYEWCTVDLSNDNQLKEVYDLLTNNYVEDEDAMFRFDYSADFICWALKPPGYVPDWHVGVRATTGNHKLVAFISGVPLELRIRKVTKRASEINYLCVHKKLRSKRLTPVLIKEVTRRCHVKGIFQAIYTAGAFLPTPISTCQYYHRPLNLKHLTTVGFSKVPPGQSIQRQIRLYNLPPRPTLPGLREVEKKDIKQISKLLRCYLARFDLAQMVSNKEVEHFIWSGRGRGEIKDGRREAQVTWAYVVEDPVTHRITDFVSFYSLPSTALPTAQRPKALPLSAAYLFYYATTKCPACADLENTDPNKIDRLTQWENETEEERKILKDRLQKLIEDALIIASQAGFDVFNALTLMDNSLFLEDLKFRIGDGSLNFYLYNYQAKPIKGGVPIGTGGSGIGIPML